MAKFLDISLKVNLRPALLATRLQIKQVENLPKEAYKYFVAITPIGKPTTWKNPKAASASYTPGNAKRSTRLVGNKIEANYAYAFRLDKLPGPGRPRWSKQAPRGMREPTRQFVIMRFNRIFRGK
jgi:hypothetical protein